ncbi:hypothetical protein PFZ79_002623 [Enterococcus hirae]|nr:hypothetical protein [Enterococcus hirae]
MTRKKRNKKSVELAQSIIETYQPESVEDIQNALKDIFGPMFEAMLQGELNHHLGYNPHEKSEKPKKLRLSSRIAVFHLFS